MIELVSAKNILKLILLDGKTFKDALKEVLSKDKNSNLKNVVSGLVGSELRHHMLFSKYLKQVGNELSDEQKISTYVYLANKLFYKRLDENKCGEFIKEQLGEFYSQVINENCDDSNKMVDSLAIVHGSIDYISIRFNTPKNLIKMWTKYYGRSNCFKTIKKNSKPADSFFIKNIINEKTSSADLDSKCVKTDVEALYKLKDGESIRNSSLVRTEVIVPMKPCIQSLVDRYHDNLVDEFSLFTASNELIFRKLLIKSEKKNGINVVVPSLEKRVSIFRDIRTYKAKNVNLFEGNDSIGFSTGISRKQDIFYVFPESSSFDKIRLYPDYLLHFDHNSYDRLTAKQKEILEAASSFIAEDGLLIYMVDTMTKKETTSQIEDFLALHNDFELVEQRQIFPFDKEDAAFYYAVLKKKALKHED